MPWAGLDSIRISLNSAREDNYMRYYHPRGYSFKDVIRSIKISKKMRGFVSLNYLTMPGFTDSQHEMDALIRLIDATEIDMIQWRNLNYDPIHYFKLMGAKTKEMTGIAEEISYLKKLFPALKMGYFNPRAAVSRRR